MPIRLTLITLWKISRSCGPCLPAVRWAQPIPAQQTEIRSPPSASAAASTAAWTWSSSITFASHEAGPLAELAGKRLSLLGVEIADHHPRAGLVQRPDGGRAEAGGPAGDECADTVDPHRRGSLFRSAWKMVSSAGARGGSLSVFRRPSRLSSPKEIAERLEEARDRTLQLVEPLSDAELNRVYSPILSPLAWDLGHIANFEELWLVQTVGHLEPLDGELGRFYDAIENPRSTRGELPILRGDELRSYLDEVRARTLEVLDGVDLESAEDPLLADGFVYELILAHEHQHNETMLQLLQMVEAYEPGRARARAAAAARRRPRDGPGGRRGGRDRRRRRMDSPTTTSARATRSSWSRSGSIEPR